MSDGDGIAQMEYTGNGAAGNGQPPRPRPRIRFGPGLAQDMPAEWAEHMLSKLAADDHRRFGMLLAAAALDINDG